MQDQQDNNLMLQSTFNEPGFMAKILIIGDSQCGKTTIIARYIDGIFHQNNVPTIGILIILKNNDIYINICAGIEFRKNPKIEVNDVDINLELWALQFRYSWIREIQSIFLQLLVNDCQINKSITVNFFKNAQGALIVFDLTNKNSFQNIQYWVRQLRLYAPHSICKILIGNKCDLENQICISQENINKVSNEFDMKYFETSAKSGQNISNAFYEIANQVIKKFTTEEMIQNYKLKKIQEFPYEKGKKLINPDKQQKQNQKQCC